jgi:hypothetical protein
MRILLLALCLVLAGCGGATESDTNADVEEDTETVFDPLVRSIDKANEVENQVLQHKDRTDQALAESEGLGDDSDDDEDD